MFQDGIDTVIVTDIEEKSGYYGISNVIVHENYMTDGLSDMHDLGEYHSISYLKIFSNKTWVLAAAPQSYNFWSLRNYIAKIY